MKIENVLTSKVTLETGSLQEYAELQEFLDEFGSNLDFGYFDCSIDKNLVLDIEFKEVSDICIFSGSFGKFEAGAQFEFSLDSNNKKKNGEGIHIKRIY